MADSSLPDEIVEAIALSNAKSIGEQPAVLSNLALANQILNTNMQQQMMVSAQQAINQITMATAAKAVALIVNAKGDNDQASTSASNQPAATAALQALRQIIQLSETLLKDFEQGRTPDAKK
jgi:hypothetical protein